MNRTKKIYFLSAFVLIIGCYVLNLSYSLFVQTEEKQIVNAVVPNLSYNLNIDNGTQSANNPLQATITIPSKSSQIITLKLNNTGNSDISYGLSLVETLTANQKVQLVDELDNDIIGTIPANTTKDVKLYIENNESSTITLTFNLAATYSTLNLDYEIDTKIIRDPKYSLLLNAIIINDTRITKNTTTPTFNGVATTELGMYSAEDDYGTSWYFRGKQSYNYVNFAGFTWRIVRINGDESIRLILDGSLDKVKHESEETYVYQNEKLLALSTSGKVRFNPQSNGSTNAYMGYMYGTVTAANYNDAHTNSNSSTMKIYIDTFYEEYIKDYQKYLADSLFCGDKRLAASTIGSSNTAKGYMTHKTYYISAQRLAYSTGTTSITTALPTLECAKGADNTYSRYTSKIDTSTTTSKNISINNDLEYPIALLSADELVMAGAFWNKSPITYYLNDGYLYDTPVLESKWITMTPFAFLEPNPNQFYGNTNGNASLYGTLNVTTTFAVRPVINLRSDLKISGGNGTHRTPYEIKEIVE